MTQSFYPNSMTHQCVSQGSHAAIIMRTKDRPILLARALSSVLAQEHQDWHLYLVNDGGAAEPLEKLLQDYRPAFGDKLTLIERPCASREGERGSSANSALPAAKGDFLALHDDDDSWRPNFLSETIRFLNKAENARYAAVATHCDLVHEVMQEQRVMETRRQPWHGFRENIAYADMLFMDFIPPISLLIRRSIARKLGLFNKALPVLEDWDYFLRLMQIGDIGTISVTLANYHQRAGGETAAFSNTITAGQNLHSKYNTLYTNALIRAFVHENPHNLGLLRLIMLKTQHLEERLNGEAYWSGVHYSKLRQAVRYSGLFGKIRKEWQRFSGKYLRK